MPLHIGESKELSIYINGVKYKLNWHSKNLITNGDVLLSSDDFILRDKNGIYLTAIKTNNLYLTAEESD